MFSLFRTVFQNGLVQEELVFCYICICPASLLLILGRGGVDHRGVYTISFQTCDVLLKLFPTEHLRVCREGEGLAFLLLDISVALSSG